ncbi:AmpG family muropeptide MFS transporter [Hirschia litorea]|uniref:AmpG family muropeptide MFS transporter n=1 Tax=Hirschia litorea TaxID=1199156 RepID=A0ABW2INA9_9PROT
MTQDNDFVSMIRRLKHPRFASMLILGFASGLPLLMVFQKLSVWLREVGIDKSTIGFMYWITIAYTLKWLWSPGVDRIKIPYLTEKLGQRRSWMIVAMVGTAVGLFVIAGSDPVNALWTTLLGAAILAYSGATLDISIDAWRIESAETQDQGFMAAIYQFGYRLAIMFSGAGLALTDYFPWYVTFSMMAGVMLTGAVLVLKMREPERNKVKVREAKPFLKSIYAAIFEPFQQFFVRFKIWIIPVIGVVMFYRLSDFTMGVMAAPLYVDLGYSKSEIGTFQSGLGIWFAFAGTFAGAFFIAKWGVIRTMIIGAPMTFITTAAYAGLASLGVPDQADIIRAANGGELVGIDVPSTWWLFTAIGADNFAGGIVGTAFIAYLSSITDSKNAATQYACLSSFYAFFCKFAAGFSGVIADSIGYVGLFLISASYVIPTFVLLVLILWKGPLAVKGESQL